MPMNPNFLCCIGAELKNSTQQTTRMSQVYLYRAFEDQTLNDMVQPGFFDAALGIIRKDDLLLLYSPNEAFAKYTYARVSNVNRDGVEIESIGIDAKDISVDTDGFSVLDGGNLQEIIAQIDSLLPSDVSSLNKLIAESRLQSEITQRAVIKDSNVVQEMQSGLKTPSVEIDNSLTVNGSAEFDNAPTTNDTTTYQNATSDSLVRKEQVDEVVQDIKTSSLTFVGYVSATEPSSATYAFNTGDLWLNSATMPTAFPFPQANIKEWNGSAWVAHSQDYTPANFDFFRNVNNNEGYYWFGGEWVVMSTDMSTTYFQLNPISGKWEIKSNVNLPGAPTTTTPSTDDNSTNIATTEFTANAITAEKQKTITNCITEIPQDIKLELADGVLTLKAGSKVYVPNGDGVFDVITTSSDLTLTYTGPTPSGNAAVFYKSGVLGLENINYTTSGSVAPTGSGIWYDTTNNLVKRYESGSMVESNLSFPICLITYGTNYSGGVGSINQVFNGFGYIGSTVFVLPGVKWLAPNGRNADGTLKNTENINTTVKAVDYPYYGDVVLYIDEDLLATSGSYVQSETEPTTSYTVWYKPSENILRSRGIGDWIITSSRIVFANAQTSPTGILSFTKKNVFHALDYGNTEYIAHQAMPSDKYIDLTLGASGTTYTAPADGWFYLNKKSGVSDGWMSMENSNSMMACITAAPTANNSMTVSVPAKKGDVVSISYSFTGTTNAFRFIYANGVQ